MPKLALLASLTPLLGRDQEAIRLHQLLCRPDGAPRLVTITGPGGVGKTSLALRVAHEAQAAFADGVFFVSLAPISDPTLVLPTLAQALSLPESPRRLWLDSLKDYLQDRQILLLLDNFEQIMTAAPLLTELLSACARLQLLVTSREALRLRGEQEFLLSPLALPDRPAVETLLQCPSIALFVQRAQAAQLEFRLTPQNAAAVAEICVRLDGLPLALELAAARIKLLPPPAMLARLRDSPLQMLSRGARDLPKRQQTLRNAVQWSYDLLDEDERRAFRWFSVFVGGSTLEAALAVLGPPASLDVLDSLASKSLLRLTRTYGGRSSLAGSGVETGDAARLVMLETIREFAWEQLAQAAELEAARRAHASFYLSFAEHCEQELTGADQKTWFQRLDREQDNLRAALRWAMEQREGDIAQRLAGALQPFWLTRGHWSEGRRWLEEALALDDPAHDLAWQDRGSGARLDPAVRAKALYGAGDLARYQGDFARARMLGEQSLASYRALADQTGVLMALVHLTRTSSFQDDQPAMQGFLAEAVALVDTLPDSVVKADAYTGLVTARFGASASQSPAEAARYSTESERINRALNNPAGLAFALIQLANSALLEGDDALAAARFDEAERLALELGDDRLYSRMALSRVMLDLRAGDFAAARHRVESTLQQAANRGDHHLPSALTMLAVVLHEQGLAVWSARVLGRAETWARTPAEVAAIQQILRLRDSRAQVRAELGEEAFAREIAAGKRLTLDDLRAIPYPPAPAPATAAVTAAAAPPADSGDSGASLTAREIEVLRLLAKDLSNLQIAERLVVSRRTVDAHLRSIYDKLGVKSRAAALRAAQAQGLLGR
jgi:predicted ATPase/DNA-binding CsgD family transcriptional regulator